MREKSRNTFTKGMDKDKAFTIFNGEQYYNATNARISTDEMGRSTGSLASVKGNKLDFTFPDVGDSWRIEIELGFELAALDGTDRFFDLTIQGINKQIPYNATEVKAFYEIIAEFINNNGYPTVIGLVAQYSSAAIVVYTDNFTMLTLVSSTHSEVAVTQESAGGTDLQVVGSTDLRDSLVVFTTPLIENGSGQTWEVTWDEFGTSSLRLVRNMKDNFSKSAPIEAVSRYEAQDIRKAYWTDGVTSIKGLNIESESAYIDAINIIPSADFSVPIPVELSQTGGSLTTGLYSVAYRLKTLGGAETSFSSFSPPFKIVKDNEDATVTKDYTGSGPTTTTKGLIFDIRGIDTNFTNIDILVATYPLSGPVVYRLVEEDVSLLGASSYEFRLTALTDEQVVDEGEVLLQPSSFVSAKTLAIKDNRLLAANIKDIDLSLDDWDSTAIRYDSAGNSSYENTTNKINPYNKDSTRAPLSADQHKFKSDGSTLGGEGTNVSFNFTTFPIQLDSLGGANDNPLPTGKAYKRFDIDKLQPDVSLNNITLPMGGLWKNYKNPFIDTWFKGYHRAEVYRFAIVFFDIKGRPSAAKWIADIRMPESGEVPHFTQTADELSGHVLGIEFNVKVTSEMKSRFTGFSIVRTPRPDNERTIMAQGLVGDVTDIDIGSDGSVGYPAPFPSGRPHAALRTDRLTTYGTIVDPEYKCIDVPYWKFFEYSPSLSGIKLRPVVAVVPNMISHLTTDDSGSTAQDHDVYAKYYGVNTGGYYEDNSLIDNITNLSVSIDESLQMPFTDPVFNGTALENSPLLSATARTDAMFTSTGRYEGFLNYMKITKDGNLEPSGTMEFATRGTKHTVVKCDSMYGAYTVSDRVITTGHINSAGQWDPTNGGPSPLNFEAFNARALADANGATWGRKLIVNFYRELINQYGGDTLASISGTEYISTGHYTSFNSISVNNEYTTTVYGGDTYINVYDESIGMSNHSRGVGFVNQHTSDNNNARGSSLFFPVESTINLDLREGRHYSTIGVGEPGGLSGPNTIDTVLPNDQFAYQSLYLREQDNLTFQGLSSFRNNTSEYDNRVYASNPKINGEPGDSWAAFDPLTFIDVDGNHGPINKLITFNDDVLYFQDSAYGKLSVNPRVTVQGSDDVDVELGSGGVLHDFNYVSTSVGSKHQWSIFKTPNAVYWFNILNKKTYRHFGEGAEEMVDMKGLHSFYTNNIDQTLVYSDNPLLGKGVHGVYDALNQEVLFTFKGQHHTKPDFTLGFSEFVDAWSSFFDFKPAIYLSTKSMLFSPKNEEGQKIYRHNVGEYLQFYDTYYDFTVDIVVNPRADETKMFENITFHTNTRNEGGYSLDQDTFDTIECYTDYQHSSLINLTPGVNIKRKEREWNLAVPRNVMKETSSTLDLFDSNNYDTTRIFKDKMRDKYMVQSYTFNGSEEADQLSLSYINTYYRTSAR